MRTGWTADAWNDAVRVFEAALDLPEAERDAYVQRACGADGELQANVRRMLGADERARTGTGHGWLEQGVLQEREPDARVGSTVGAWRIESRIAEGGMGTVYRAVRADGAFPRPVALKLLHVGLASDAMRKRFLREPQLLGRIEHPHIARVLDGGSTADGVPFLAMELVEGERIDRWCDAKRLGLAARLRLFAAVCSAVDHAHRALVVHRDLKPSNILVTRSGEPRIVDFGVAGLLADAADLPPGGSPEPATSQHAYTLEYASPEQLRGEPVGTASDVWSLGVVLHELLTGQRPFDSAAARRRAFGGEPPESAPLASAAFGPAAANAGERAAARGATREALARALRGDLDTILGVALAAERDRRYPSCREFAADVLRHLDGYPIAVRKEGYWYGAAKFVRRHRASTALAIALALSLAAGTVASLRMAARAEHERAAARAEAEHAQTEAASAELIARSITDIFLHSRFFGAAEQRELARDRLLGEAASIRVRHAVDPHLRANLLDALGHAALQIELSDDAESLVREALEVRTAEFGREHMEVALSLGSLGKVRYARGDYPGARTAFAEALELHLRFPEAVHADVALAKNDLAAALAGCGDHAGALALHREALALRRARKDGELQIAESLNNVGGALLRAGHTEEAMQAIDEAIALRSKVLGPGSMLALQSLANRGVMRLKLRDAEGGLADLEQAVAGLRELHAAGTEPLAIFLQRLALARLQQGDLAGADAATAEAEDLARALFGPEHPRTADVIEQRARMHEARGDRAAAVAAWEDVLRIRRAALPGDHPSLATTLNNLGLARRDAGDAAGARADLEQSIAVRDDDSARDAISRFGLATIHFAAGDLAAAEADMAEALRDAAPDDRELRSAVRAGLARVYRATGREPEAAELERGGG